MKIFNYLIALSSVAVAVSATAETKNPPIGHSAITVHPNTFDFGALNLGTSDSTSFIVLNNSARPIYFGGFDGLATPFSIVGGNCPFGNVALPAKQSCVVNVAYAPMFTAQVNATMQVSFGETLQSNKSYSSSLALTGRGQ